MQRRDFSTSSSGWAPACFAHFSHGITALLVADVVMIYLPATLSAFGGPV